MIARRLCIAFSGSLLAACAPGPAIAPVPERSMTPQRAARVAVERMAESGGAAQYGVEKQHVLKLLPLRSDEPDAAGGRTVMPVQIKGGNR